jgi:hypothetical protein
MITCSKYEVLYNLDVEGEAERAIYRMLADTPDAAILTAEIVEMDVGMIGLLNLPIPGRYYRTKEGKRVKIARNDCSNIWRWDGDNGETYDDNGRLNSNTYSALDLEELWEEEPTVVTHPQPGEYWMDRSGCVHHIVQKFEDGRTYALVESEWDEGRVVSESADMWTLDGQYQEGKISSLDLVKQVKVTDI